MLYPRAPGTLFMGVATTLSTILLSTVFLSGILLSNAARADPLGDLIGRYTAWRGPMACARFHLIIDYAHDRLFATAIPDARNTGFDRDRLGLHFSQKGCDLIVDFVSPGSPAAAAGFAIGDHVTAIDRKPAATWSNAALNDLRHRPAGTMVTIVRAHTDTTIAQARTETKRIELAEFY